MRENGVISFRAGLLLLAAVAKKQAPFSLASSMTKLQR